MADDDGWRLGHRRGLDQLRGVAVLVVLVTHGLVGTSVDKAGAVGVSMFFVLSGFLITRLLVEERWRTGRIGLRAFYGRRVRRLLPALPAALAVCAIGNFVVGGPQPIMEPVLATLTYTANFTSATDSYGSFGHMWSLAVEEHFYLVWPLVVALLPLRWLPWLASAGVVLSALGRLVEPSQALAYQGTQYRVDAILIGALVALFIGRIRTPGRATVAAAVTVLALFVPNGSWDVMVRWGATAVALAAAVVVVCGLGAVRARPLLERVGRTSYGAYLFHSPVSWVMWRRFDAHPALTLVVTVVGGLLLAELSWRMIEGPISRRSRRAASVERETARRHEVSA